MKKTAYLPICLFAYLPICLFAYLPIFLFAYFLFDFSSSGLWQSFLFFNGVPEAREVFRNLPEARGSIFRKYEPMASHGDPIQVQNYLN